MVDEESGAKILYPNLYRVLGLTLSKQPHKE